MISRCRDWMRSTMRSNRCYSPAFVFPHIYIYIYATQLDQAIHKRTRPQPVVSVAHKETDDNPSLHMIAYRSMRRTLPTLPRLLPVPRTKRSTLRSASDVKSEFTKYLIQNSRIPGPVIGRCPGASHGASLFACSTSLPAPHRSVRYPLLIVTPTSAINQTAPAAAVEVTTYY